MLLMLYQYIISRTDKANEVSCLRRTNAVIGDQFGGTRVRCWDTGGGDRFVGFDVAGDFVVEFQQLGEKL